MICEELVRIADGSGALAGRIAYDDGDDPRFLALVAPPHPLLGGTPDNPAVLALMEGCAAAGGLALTWEYAVAASTMDAAEVAARRAAFWDDPAAMRGYAGEIAEAARCVAWMRARRFAPAGCPLLFAGYSFGGALALVAAPADSPVLAVSAPIGALPSERPIVSERLSLAWPHDDVAASDEAIDAFVRAHAGRVRFVVRLGGDDHFLRGSSDAMRDVASQWATRESRYSPASMPHASSLL